MNSSFDSSRRCENLAWYADLALLLRSDIPAPDLAQLLPLDWAGPVVPEDKPTPKPQLPPPKRRPLTLPPVGPRPRPRFLLPVSVRFLQPSRTPLPEVEQADPMPDEELSVPWGTPGVPHQPLSPWPRLGPQLRARLATARPRDRLDLRKLIRLVGRGEPILRLPRLAARGWPRELVLLQDVSLAMAPFLPDLHHLADALRRELGSHAVLVHRLDGAPARPLSTLPAGAPVLLASSMGFRPPLSPSDSALPDPRFDSDCHAWARLGHDLQRCGHSLHALVPVPRRWWVPAFTGPWPLLEWSAHNRLPRAGGQGAVSEPTDFTTAEELLRLLAPAPFVRPELLRSARRLLPAADTGSEFLAWFHPETDPGRDAFDFLPRPNAHRLGEREALQLETPDRFDTADRLIQLELDRCDPAVACGGLACMPHSSPANHDALMVTLPRIVSRLRQAVERGEAARGVLKGVLDWFPVMASQLAFRLPSDPTLAGQITDGLALCQVLRPSPSDPLPEGIDPADYLEHLRRYQSAGVLRRSAVFLGAAGLRLGPLPPPGEAARELFRTEADAHPVLVSGGPEGVASTPSLVASIDLPPDLDHPLWVSSAFQETLLLPIEQLDWASRMGVDRFGTWAEFEVGPVTVTLRWIPPGRFPMGERGHAKETVVTHGFWMADSPCTQALWVEVMDKNPSYFPEDKPWSPGRLKAALNRLRGTKAASSPEEAWMRLPVECVTWKDCQSFFEKFGRRQPGLQFGLPSEAQWEYACRAGTQSDFNNGRDDGLEDLGWFEKNSGGRTHPVKEKAPNAWGLYDLHGNVWEWCSDYGKSRVGRVVRGGSWDGAARGCRSAFRFEGPPGLRYRFRGFRFLAGRAQPPPEANDANASGAKSSDAPVIRLWSADAVLPTQEGPSVAPPATPFWQPAWAATAGEDEHGRWAAFGLREADFRFRWIEPDTFWMGSPKDEEGRYEDEGPRHEVTLTKGFWMAETPTTQSQWLAVMPENPSGFQGLQRPVEQVSWLDCQDFLQQLNRERPGLVADLPTEAEWEYACRAGTTSAFNHGRNDHLEEIAWFNANSGGQTHPVKQKPGNAWGLYDMHGNVDEWCKDGKRSYTSKPVIDPLGSQRDRVARVVRGGSWINPAGWCRSAYRSEWPPVNRTRLRGFRFLAGRA